MQTVGSQYEKSVQSSNQKLTYTIPEVAEILNLSLAHTYKLCSDQVLPTIRLGKRILVSVKKLEEFINQ